MKLLITSRFNRNMYAPLSKLVAINRLEYTQAQQYEYVYVDTTKQFYSKDPSWRHPEVILEALTDPMNKDFDFIANTGQYNIVTNKSISIESQIEKYFDESKHEIILQSWMANPKFNPVVLESVGKTKPLKLKYLKKPYLAMLGE